MHLRAPGTLKLHREPAMHFLCTPQHCCGRHYEDGQGSALCFLSLHPYHVPQTKGTPSFTKYKWMLPLASFWRRWKGKKIASLTGFLLAMTLLLEYRLFQAYLQNQLMYISFAATPGNGCLPSRKTLFRQKP